MKNYIAYHVHSDDSLLDSCTKFKDYVDKAVELGQKAICFTEHGNIYNWIEKKMYCDSKGIKYLHGVEMYITQTFDEKIRDNMHTILIAKNQEGFEELNILIDKSTRKDHMFYKNRISINEFLDISDNIIKISACLASPLNKLRLNKMQLDSDTYNKLMNKYDFYEIQLQENSDEQREYNDWLYLQSKIYNKPLIVGTDYHSINQYKAECRLVLKERKGIEYATEDDFDLTYKTYDELIEKGRKQNLNMPFEEVVKALDNTNLLYDMCFDIVLDKSFKYPILSDNDEELFKKTINTKYKEKCKLGIIDKNNKKYINNIKEEFKVFKKLGMCSFMMFMSEMCTWCRENGVALGISRGSCGGSTIAYITDITDLDPVKWNTVFSRFCNEHRKELGDIDLDFDPNQRDLVYEYIINRFTDEKSAYILSIGTIAEKGTIDDIGGCLNKRFFKAHPELDEDKDKEKSPYSLSKVAKIKALYDENPELAKETYKELFYYFDGLLGTNISQSFHPAGIVASPITLPNNYGTFWNSEGKRILQINMDEVHEVCLVKYDILGLKTVGIIRNAYELIGKNYPRAHEINWNDEKVWEDIKTSPIGIFQFEGSFAFDLLRKYDAKSIDDMSLCNACLRPSGASYRDRVMNHEKNHNPSEEIDKLLEANNGFLVYQEDTIKFLTDICGLSGGDADNIRRAIGHKDHERLNKAMPDILEGYCSKSSKPREVAEKEAREFLQIIEDASSYQFGYNHSTGYSMLGYICGYLRYYYPVEFIASYLNNASNNDDILNGEKLAKLKGVTIKNARFRHSRGDYISEPTTMSVYKGIASIKFMNKTMSDEMYELRNNEYSTFIDLLFDLKYKTSINSKQLDRLIKISFFEEFGNVKTLLKLVEIFNKFYDKKSFTKNKIIELGLESIDMSKYGNNISEKTGKETNTYKNIDNKGLLNDFCKDIKLDEFSISELAMFEAEILGNISMVDKNANKFDCILLSSNKNKYGTTFFNLYLLKNGKSYDIKVDKQSVDIFGIPKDLSALRITNIIKKEKKRRNEQNKWVGTGEYEKILVSWEIL